MSELNEIEYIEPTQEHVGQMVEVRDRKDREWQEGQLTGILADDFKFAVKRPSDMSSWGWREARIASPKPQPAVEEEPQPKPIDWTKPVRTKDGRAVRVLCTDGPGDYPVVGLVLEIAEPQTWTIGGQFLDDTTRNLDLENAPRRIQREYWVNVYEGVAELYSYHSKKEADENAGDRFACVKITIDCEDGEGL